MATWCINPLEVLLLLVPLLALTYFHFIYQKEVVDSNLDSKTSKIQKQGVYVIRNRSGANYSRITDIIRTMTKEHSE